MVRVQWQKTLGSFTPEDAGMLPRWAAEVVLKRREMSAELQKVRPVLRGCATLRAGRKGVRWC